MSSGRYVTVSKYIITCTKSFSTAHRVLSVNAVIFSWQPSTTDEGSIQYDSNTRYSFCGSFTARTLASFSKTRVTSRFFSDPGTKARCLSKRPFQSTFAKGDSDLPAAERNPCGIHLSR